MRILLLLLFVLPLRAATVELRAEAEASGPFVSLGEVAAVDGDPLWAGIFLAPAPEAGADLLLTREAVQGRLDYLGIAARVTGAERAVVRRGSSSSLPARLRLDAASEALRLLGPGLSLAEPVEIPAGWTSVEILEAAVEGDRARITMRGNGDEAVVRIGLRKVRRVAVAARDLKASERLASSDLSWRDLPEGEVPAGALADPARCLGRQLQRAVPAGGVLLSQSLTSPRLVSRGQACTLVETEGKVRLRCQGKALSDGRLDEVIGFQILDSGKTVPARVRAEGEAELRLEEAP